MSNSHAPSRPAESDPLGGGESVSSPPRPPGDPDASKLENHWPIDLWDRTQKVCNMVNDASPVDYVYPEFQQLKVQKTSDSKGEISGSPSPLPLH